MRFGLGWGGDAIVEALWVENIQYFLFFKIENKNLNQTYSLNLKI